MFSDPKFGYLVSENVENVDSSLLEVYDCYHIRCCSRWLVLVVETFRHEFLASFNIHSPFGL